MEFKRRRMIKSEIDRLLSDEGTRNLLSGIKRVGANTAANGKKFPPRVVTRNRVVVGGFDAGGKKGRVVTPERNRNKDKTQQLIKKSISLLGQSNKHIKLTNGSSSSTTTAKIPNDFKQGTSSSSGGNNVKVKVASSSSPQFHNTPNFPLLATLVRGHVAFITLSYQNHLCTLRTQDLRDLVRKLEEYESRRGISVIVVNSSSDRIFCDGLDYKELIHGDLNKRRVGVEKRIDAIKNVLISLAKSKKLLIGSVNGGKVNGFGFILLGAMDLVYANDKATFSIQKYFQMKQPPEGISVFNQAQLQTPTMKSFVFTGKVCTALELHQSGFLVTEVLWDGGKYHEQLGSKLQSVNSLEHTKSVYKTYSGKGVKQLGADLANELSVLETTWMSDSWQKQAVQQINRERIDN